MNYIYLSVSNIYNLSHTVFPFNKIVVTLTSYPDGLILSPNNTCPRFSVGDLLSSEVQKSKLKVQKEIN